MVLNSWNSRCLSTPHLCVNCSLVPLRVFAAGPTCLCEQVNPAVSGVCQHLPCIATADVGSASWVEMAWMLPCLLI